ncbi:MAG: AI-2E family transporter, partial [Candidatus Eisenbacteria bacterium]|nr:AI-2E family transporter [Candidatus Eisenbacteria bacterium]
MTETWMARALLAGTLLLLGFLLYPVLGLAPLFAIAFILWYPTRHGSDGRAVFAVVAFLFVAWILHQVRWVVYPLLAAMLIAYWLDPLVDRLERWKLPRALGALIALLPIAIFLAVAALVLIPTLVNQLEEITTKVPDAIAAIQSQLEPLRSRLELLSRGGQMPDWVQKGLEHVGSLLKAAIAGMSGLGKGVGKAIQLLGMLALVPVLAFYLLVDWDRIRDGLVGLVP